MPLGIIIKEKGVYHTACECGDSNAGGPGCKHSHVERGGCCIYVVSSRNALLMSILSRGPSALCLTLNTHFNQECVILEDELRGARFFKLQKIQILSFKKYRKNTRV
jgi:hypothetical protein